MSGSRLKCSLDLGPVDFRVYALVTACLPTLRVFVHREGLARLATIPYKEPTSGNLQHVRL